MCDHSRNVKQYRNIRYCEKCDLVLGPIYKVGRIRTINQVNSNNKVSVLDVLEDSIKIKMKKSVENVVI